MSSFRTQNNVTVTIDKARNHFVGAKCVNPLKDSGISIEVSLNNYCKEWGDCVALPHVTGHVPHKIVNGEFVRL